MSERSRLSVRWVDSVACVTLLDPHILEEPEIEKIGQQLAELIDTADKPDVLISFARVKRLSSSGLGMLVATRKQIREKSGRLRLSDIADPIFEIFQITRLDTLFEVLDKAENALGDADTDPPHTLA